MRSADVIDSQEHRGRPERPARRVARGAALGALPGLLLAIVPLLLHGVGLISSDQSQIGFLGLPLLVIGTVVGAAVAAAESGDTGAVLLGCGVGFFVGIVAGAFVAAATSLPGVWLLTTPLVMIAGAAFFTRLRRGGDRQLTPRS